jgi:hypothetical protein
MLRYKYIAYLGDIKCFFKYLYHINTHTPLGRPRRRREDNIKMDLHEVGGRFGDWRELAQDRDRWRALVSTVRNLRVPKMRGIS